MGTSAKIGIAAAALVAIAGLGMYWLSGASDQRVRELAAPRMACEASEIRVVESFQGDTTETYELEGCGKSGTLLCAAPDFDCVFAPTK